MKKESYFFFCRNWPANSKWLTLKDLKLITGKIAFLCVFCLSFPVLAVSKCHTSFDSGEPSVSVQLIYSTNFTSALSENGWIYQSQSKWGVSSLFFFFFFNGNPYIVKPCTVMGKIYYFPGFGWYQVKFCLQSQHLKLFMSLSQNNTFVFPRSQDNFLEISRK